MRSPHDHPLPLSVGAAQLLVLAADPLGAVISDFGTAFYRPNGTKALIWKPGVECFYHWAMRSLHNWAGRNTDWRERHVEDREQLVEMLRDLHRRELLRVRAFMPKDGRYNSQCFICRPSYRWTNKTMSLYGDRDRWLRRRNPTTS